jgi:hypothetical protein
MASSIDASTSGAGGVITTADNTGILQLKTAGVVAVTVNASSALGVGTSPSFGTSGQVLTSAGSSAAPTWSTISSGGMTLLGTLTTTSGTSQTLSGLTLTNYKYLFITIQNVSFSNAASLTKEPNAVLISRNTDASGDALWGTMLVDLSTGTFSSATSISTSGAGEKGQQGMTFTGRVDWSTANTSLVFGTNQGGTFDAGSIKVYGVS